ncbi:MAG: creatininase family protein [Proteobacteria bacterium]|nr:creatininase family protein [Pseudomonadota bacterium]
MPGTRSRWIHEMSFNEVEAHLRKDDVALVPIGATEQHGHHAPLMLDTAWAISASEAAAEIADVLIAPPVHYGWSYSHMRFSGALTLSADTLRRVCEDVTRSLIWHGFKRVILVNGNRVANLPPMEIAATRLRNQTGAFVAVADCGLIAQEEVMEISEGGTGCNGHAGESETSMILYRFPQFTDMKKAVDGMKSNIKKREKGSRQLYHGHLNIDPRLRGDCVFVPMTPADLLALSRGTRGVRGKATAATAEKGKRMVQAIARNLAAFIAHARKVKVDVRPVDFPV